MVVACDVTAATGKSGELSLQWLELLEPIPGRVRGRPWSPGLGRPGVLLLEESTLQAEPDARSNGGDKEVSHLSTLLPTPVHNTTLLLRPWDLET